MRLDVFLFENKYFDSRTKASQAVERGVVKVGDKIIKKPSFDVEQGCKIEIVDCDFFVSLGGYKLQKALSDFNFNVSGMICADIGASTGGFTDCLLKNGAKRVYSVDLNEDLLHESLKNNKNVVPIIKNVRELTKRDFKENVDIAVADLSFISATKFLDILSDIINPEKYIILLIKPQFENDAKIKFKNGIIRDEKIILSACKKVYDYAIKCNLVPLMATNAPIYEDKNNEFLILLRKGCGQILPFEKVFDKALFL